MICTVAFPSGFTAFSPVISAFANGGSSAFTQKMYGPVVVCSRNPRRTTDPFPSASFAASTDFGGTAFGSASRA